MFLWGRARPFFVAYLAAQTTVRGAFLIKEWSSLDGIAAALKAMAIGLSFDIAVFAYFLLPLGLYLLLLPSRRHGTVFDRALAGVLFGLFVYVVLLSAVSEWLFWDEFAARFNFIAVDYLVYTHEVIGNIRESYPVLPLLAGIAAVAVLAGLAYASRLHVFDQATFRLRAWNLGLCIAFALGSYSCTPGEWSVASRNRYENEISKNGIYELFSAYRHNELDYSRFYTTREDEAVIADRLREQIDGGPGQFTGDGITHRVYASGPEHRYNIVLVTVESLSAAFLGTFGNAEGLTPYLDMLTKDSLVFTRLYATGTRTVYGLSSLTLSIPPLPGNAIARRPGNERLFGLSSVLNGKGYVSKFIYGGFGYFDNMNYFFGNNGYKIIDRASMSGDEITFSNIWGVADEDLFRRTIRENDKAYAAGRPFFDMVLTTSNHRPFTFPDGRIDIPSHSGRRGGVKYTDYALRQLIEESRTRPWFKDTIFVIVGDHTAGGAGKSELDPFAYHVPMLIYGPGIVKPGRVETIASQIDVAPTLLGLLNMTYVSRFYGRDVLRAPLDRALISNYQQLGYLTRDNLVILKPVKKLTVHRREDDTYVEQAHPGRGLEEVAISYFQNAAKWKELNRAIGPSSCDADSHLDRTQGECE